MTRRKGGSLEYDVAPDLVQPGAKEHRDEPPRRQRGASARLDYDPEPFPGSRAPAGPSPDAVATLKARGMWTPPEPAREPPRQEAPVPPPRVRAAVEAPQAPRPAPRREELPPSRPASRSAPDTRPTASPPLPLPPVPPTPASREPGPTPARPPTAGSPARQPVASPGTPAPAPPVSSRPRGRPRIVADAEGGEIRIARTVRLAPRVDAQLQAIAARFGVDLTAAVAIAVTHGYQALAAAGLVRPVETSPPS